MNCSDFMKGVICRIAAAISVDRTQKQIHAAIDRINPVPAVGGFTEVKSVISCPCGEPVFLAASPRQHTEEEIQEKMKHPEEGCAFVQLTPKGCTHTDPTVVATNMGFTATTCDSCGRQFIATWNFETIEIAKDVKLPWVAAEVPTSPASGLSFTAMKRQSGTVH